ncbi:MAG: hypothetical protein ACFN3G_02450, partial [Granulicatella adiacens]
MYYYGDNIAPYSNEVGKDTLIQFIILFKEEKATIYQVFGLDITLGQLSKMSENEIKDKLTEWDKTSKEKYINDRKSDNRRSSDLLRKKEIEKLANTEDEKAFFTPIVTNYKFILETDNTGNETKKEVLWFNSWVSDLRLKDVNHENIYAPLEVKTFDFNGFYSLTVYDTSYMINVGDGKSDFAIRYNEKINLYVDSPKSKIKNINVK